MKNSKFDELIIIIIIINTNNNYLKQLLLMILQICLKISKFNLISF